MGWLMDLPQVKEKTWALNVKRTNERESWAEI